jgi:hypothetical protein
MVQTFRNMDVGIKDHDDDDDRAHSESSNRARAFNSLLEPEELAVGINKNLNMDISPNEVHEILKIIDSDGDGSINFTEFVQALRGDRVQKYIDQEYKNKPNHNITRKLFLKSKVMAPKIGSTSWTLTNSINHREENNEQNPHPDNSMIAKFAVRDMNDDHHKCNHNILGWSGPPILTAARGHVNWVGTKRHGRGGPLLGPKVPEDDIDIRNKSKFNNIAPYRSGKDRIDYANKSSKSIWSPSVQKNSGGYNDQKDDLHLHMNNFGDDRHKTPVWSTKGRTLKPGVTGKPHQGGRAYESQLNFCFDNQGTINERMDEIYNIVGHHQAIQKEKDRKQNQINQEKEYIARRNRYLKHNPPIKDPRTTNERMQDEILAHYTKRRYRRGR